jgi:hypothetical protein
LGSRLYVVLIAVNSHCGSNYVFRVAWRVEVLREILPLSGERAAHGDRGSPRLPC